VSGLVVDTSSWISYFAGAGSPLINRSLEAGEVYLPSVVAAELTSSKLSPRDRLALEALLADLPLWEGGLEHWLRVGRLRAALFGAGLSMSVADAHVAQCAIDLDAALLTEDGIFAKVARRAGFRLA
jgi:predicted nucleic acid-binding protein